jgi:putative heme-binding domain-containing protein
LRFDEQAEARGGREEVLPTDEVRLEIELKTGISDLSFDVSYHADFDPNERPLRLEHLSIPWAPKVDPPEPESEKDWRVPSVPGDPQKGRELFFGNETNCSLCHAFDGRGGKVAVDLTASVHRGPDAILHDIVNPSASINPEYVSYAVTTTEGENLVGLFLSADEKEITFVDVAANTHTVQRGNIETIEALPVSLMPAGFATLGKEKLQDLVAFLCGGDHLQADGSTGGLLREYWLEVPNSGDIQSLTNHKDFPDKPSGSDLIKQFEGPVNWKEAFGSRIRGYLDAPQTGDYTFEMAADDYAELWLGPGGNAAGKSRILKMDRWTPSQDWDRYPEQKSEPIRLEAGKRYYIEAIQYERAVDDCIAVGWTLPDGTVERPIPGNRLRPFVK